MSVKPDGGGLRYTEGKLARYDLIPPEALEALAIHYGQGAAKYGDRNWERGMKWSNVFAPLMRHAWRWWRGKSYDDEDPRMPGFRAHHMIAVAWNAFAAYTYDVRRIGTDDRPGTMPAPQAAAPLAATPDTHIGVIYGAPPGVDIILGDGVTRTGGGLLMNTANREAPAPKAKPPVTLWYLATPYTSWSIGAEAAAAFACATAAKLLASKVPVFSPIAHSHALVEDGLRDVQFDHEFWVWADAPMVEACGGLIVPTYHRHNNGRREIPWTMSKGIAHEIKRVTAAGKPIVFWDMTAGLPQELQR